MQKNREQQRLSRFLLLIILFSIIYSAPLLADTQDEYYTAPPSAIVDLNAPQPVKRQNKQKGLLSDIQTSVNFDVNTNNKENEPINNTSITANFRVSKGPAYFQYTHSRTYSRNVDPFYTDVNNEFEGYVNNRFSVGVSFTPEFNKTTNVAVNEDADSEMKASSVGYNAVE